MCSLTFEIDDIGVEDYYYYDENMDYDMCKEGQSYAGATYDGKCKLYYDAKSSFCCLSSYFKLFEYTGYMVSSI